MHTLSRQLKVVGALLAVVVVFGAVAASPAMAEEVKAKFSGTSLKLTTSGITLAAVNKSTGSKETKTCTINGGSTSGSVVENGAWLINNPENLNTKFTCTGGTTFELTTAFEAWYNTTTSTYILVLPFNYSSQASPWGTYLQIFGATEGRGTWVNGSGGTNSTLSYSEEEIGETGTKKLKISGTFTATTSSGGLITLSH